jgi:deoxyribodipyrimidine photo-lyase
MNVLRDLKRGLKELGTDLHIFYGKPEDVFSDLSAQYGALDVVCLREPVSPEWTDVENYVQAAVKAKGGSLTTLWGAMSLYHEDDSPYTHKEAPTSYSSLAKELGWKSLWTSKDRYRWATPIRTPIPAPTGLSKLEKAATPPGAWADTIIDSDPEWLRNLGYSPEEIETTLKSVHGGSRKGKGGETAAWQRFKAFLDAPAVPEKVDPNFVTLGAEYGAAGASYIVEGEVDPFQWKNLSQANGWMQLSKYMACGCISPREMYHTLKENDHWALPGVVHRFMWREWHRLNAIKYKTWLFRLQGPGGQHQMSLLGSSIQAERWAKAQTGIPYIDACMRELNQTGWIAYHSRKTVACFLSHDLLVDWRFGGFHFEEVLLDYDVAMNYGNWSFCVRVDKPYESVYAAEGWRDGEHRNVIKAIKAHAANDPEGHYVRQWVPELSQVPQEFLHTPWLMSAEQMKDAKCTIGEHYPTPLIELKLWGKWPIAEKRNDRDEEDMRRKAAVKFSPVVSAIKALSAKSAFGAEPQVRNCTIC